MPRGPRLDVPGTLHHVIFRGIEGNRIVYDDQDRAWLVDKLAKLSYASRTAIFAWAIMDNHVHLLLKSGPEGLSSFMRKLLTSYAITFNRRHNRHGYLFQNRYKSIVCQEELYFLRLISYIHLNPFRAGLVKNLDQLDHFPWSGHAALMGYRPNQWQQCDKVLDLFGSEPSCSRTAYRAFIDELSHYGHQPELTGGRLIRSDGGWAEIKSRHSQQDTMSRRRLILGDEVFTNTMLDQAQEHLGLRLKQEYNLQQAKDFVASLCREHNVSVNELQEGKRCRQISPVRSKAASILLTEYRLTKAETARLLGISTQAVYRIVEKTTKNDG